MEIVSTQKNGTGQPSQRKTSYYAHTDKPLSNIYLPRDAITCSDVNCKDVKHANIYASCIMV